MNEGKNRELTAQYMMNLLMADVNEWLERLEDPENESHVMSKNCQGWLRKIECLMTQIQEDSERGDKRSTFRKLVLLRGLLMTKLG